MSSPATHTATPASPNASQFEVLARLHQPVWVFDVDHARVHWSNAAGLTIWNASSLDELRSRDMGADMSPEVARRLQQYRADFQRDPDRRFSELWTLYPQGTPTTLQVVYSAFALDDGRMAIMIEALGEHPLDAETLRSAEALLHTPVMISLYAPDGTALYRNPAARAALDDAVQRLDQRFLSPDDLHNVRASLETDGVADLTACIHTAAGPRWHDVSARRCHDAVTGSDALLISEVDVSSLKSAEHRAQFLADHDPLTRLPNRNYIARHFDSRLQELANRGERGAVVFIDLDHFKHVNDTLGHAAGDRLLVQTASRLRTVVRQVDLIARLGGDEFLLLLSAKDIVRHVQDVAARVAEALSAPLHLAGREVRVTPTLGASLYPDDGKDLETLMSHADLAVYRAKERGRNTLAFFTPDLSSAVRHRLALERDIRDGLERGEFQVYFQPRLCLQDDAVVGAEALARWHHPARGLIAPDGFIPACEEMGFIAELGYQVFAQSVAQQIRWRDAGWPLRISVNLSSLQITQPDLAQSLLKIVTARGADPRDFQLEITESMLLGHDSQTLGTIEQLRDAGFQIAIDDFGTGYSNLAYLQRYQLDCLKIDRSFVSTLETGTALTEMIVSMATLLEMEIVAEGVETPAQRAWLREHGCHEYQGFLFSPALPAEEFTALLAALPAARAPARSASACAIDRHRNR